MRLLPASEFTLEQLTDAYNQTRTDYLIPMPMNPGRLQEYITLYDVDLDSSRVALEGDNIIGLGMLGVRSGLGWITRLGVLPDGRRKGVGGALLEALLEESAAKSNSGVWLEVIAGNSPAHELFRKYQFEETRELVIGRRSPRTARNVAAINHVGMVRYLQHDEVIELHCRRMERMNWLNGVETMRNVRRLLPLALDSIDQGPLHEVSHLAGLHAEFQDGSEGWVSYQATTLQLKRISVDVVRGDLQRITSALLELLHRLHSSQDATIENVPDDERWAGFQQAGYFEVFRRIEMVRTGG